jgi:hypothetical protein
MCDDLQYMNMKYGQAYSWAMYRKGEFVTERSKLLYVCCFLSSTQHVLESTVKTAPVCNSKQYSAFGACVFVSSFSTELLLNAKRWRVEEYLEVIASVTPKTLQAFISRMFSR